MLRIILLSVFLAAGVAPASAQVENIGAVSFAVIPGWTYQQGRDFGAIANKTESRFWMIAVYSEMPSSGTPEIDFKTAWQRVLIGGMNYAGLPGYSPYAFRDTVGFAGVYYEAASPDQKTYTRLYVVETGKTFVPVAFVSLNRPSLDGMEHNAKAVIGSVRVAPLKAVPVKYSISLADLAGSWTNGIVTSTDVYNHAGQYQSNSLTALNAGYTIAANGTYSYKYGGLLNNKMTTGDDSGVIELAGGLLTLKGQKFVTKYRFLNLQQALDGSTVVQLWPVVDVSKAGQARDAVYWTRR